MAFRDCRIRSRLYDCRIRIHKALPNAYASLCSRSHLDGAVRLHRNSRPAMALPAVREMVLRKMVVQQGLSCQAVCPLRITQVWVVLSSKAAQGILRFAQDDNLAEGKS